jgi:hypothetical protein
MLTSVAREYHWPPEILGGFFVDNVDLYGLEFWYNDVFEVHEELKQKK